VPQQILTPSMPGNYDSDGGAQADGGRAMPATANGAALVRILAASLVLTAAAIAGVLLLVNRDDWWRGFFAAGVIAVLSAMLTVPPLIWSLRGGAQRMVVGYFVSAALRALLSLGGCVLAVEVGNYPPAATLVLMVPFYFALLAVESAFVARRLWSAKL
jgi:hypothetical protein